MCVFVVCVFMYNIYPEGQGGAAVNNGGGAGGEGGAGGAGGEGGGDAFQTVSKGSRSDGGRGSIDCLNGGRASSGPSNGDVSVISRAQLQIQVEDVCVCVRVCVRACV